MKAKPSKKKKIMKVKCVEIKDKEEYDLVIC